MGHRLSGLRHAQEHYRRAPLTAATDSALLTRMFLRVGALRWLKRRLPLEEIVRRTWQPAAGDSTADELQRIVRLARWASRLWSPPERGCLEQALVTYRHLLASGHRPVLHVGMRSEAGHWSGHAWLELDGAVIGDSPEHVNRFVRILSFGSDGRARNASNPRSAGSSIRGEMGKKQQASS